jgi:RNA polymerase sigma-70 factor, ECF subfamily
VPLAPDPDEALMKRLQAGDPSAFQILYERYHRAVFAFLARSVADRRIAEDLLQETFLRVFASRQAYRPLAPFRAWLYAIARHLVVDQMRRAQPSATSIEDLSQGVADPQASALECAEAQALGERLERAVARLPPGQREVLLLSRMGGLTHEEIGRVTGASPAAVRVALHRALRTLRDLLDRP